VLTDECGPAILRWIVDGAVKFYNAGCRLAKPACVQEATDEYLSSEDSIGQFLDECCELQEDAMTSLSDLYTSYHYWAESQGVRPYTKKRFGQMLTRRGYEQYRTNASRMWVGIALSDGL
jgi:phage/plasmid-associated DNA primase